MKRILTSKLFLYGVLCVCVFSAFFVGWGFWTWVPRDKGNAADITENHMIDILEIVQAYYNQDNALPDPNCWISILDNYLGNTDERRRFDNELSDGWGGPFKCQIVRHGASSEFQLRSFGPNRLDDQGLGDDIVIAIRQGSVVFVNGGTFGK